ncbi:MAG: ATP-binding protein [Vicinamibacteria bacterium]
MSEDAIHEIDGLGMDELRARLRDAGDALRAIQNGEVDALPVSDGDADKVFTLKSADAPYRAMVEQMQGGAVTLNSKGDVLYSNRSFAELIGWPLERVLGSSIDEFIEGTDQATLSELLLAGAGALRTRLLTKSGTPLDAHVSVSQMTLDDAEHRTLIVTDLSTMTKVQRENQSKDEFLAMLAHELRNPLAPIRTGLQILKLSPQGETADRAREMMDRQLTQMIRLIDDLLDVSRVSRGKIELQREVLDLKAIVGLAIETSLPLIEAGGHHLVVQLPSEPIPVEADATRMAQVFSNLLNNAARYTPDGGQIELKAEVGLGEVAIRVTDNGVGIPREMVSEVFEMFSQVGRNPDRAQGGLGIGLTLVRRLTEMHGGQVSAESPGMGEGSVFTVTMPLAASAAPEASTDSHPKDTVAGSDEKLRVLVVDDNLDAANMLAMLVGMHGHSTEIAHSGPEALSKLNSFPAQVIFLDIGLPGLNGYEVAQRIRGLEASQKHARAKLIALTGWGSDEDKKRSREAGFDMHMTKPLDAEKIEALLNGFVSQLSPVTTQTGS